MAEPLKNQTPKRAVIATAASGDTTLVPAVPGKSLRVTDYTAVAAGTVSVKFKSAATDISGAMPLVANAQLQSVDAAAGVLQTAQGEALVLNLSAAIAVGGHLTYVEV